MRHGPNAIGLDLGTSAVKAVLLAADGRLLAEAGQVPPQLLALGLDAADVLRSPPTDRVFEPVAAHQAVLAPRLARFRQACAPVRSLQPDA